MWKARTKRMGESIKLHMLSPILFVRIYLWVNPMPARTNRTPHPCYKMYRLKSWSFTMPATICFT